MPVDIERRRAQWRASQQRRRAGIPARSNQPCGTVAAARRHYRNNEPPCEACKNAERERARDRRRR